MTVFAFSTVPSILSEPDLTHRLGAIIAERFPQVRHPFIVTDAGFLAPACSRCRRSAWSRKA